ncbi:MAG TPA: hypothetical protein ENG70_00340 [Candidatus Cloacimonetes bacterium]|nr:hypothetical protein [Candidatus Cloacimonadota bacterium]HEX37305.1 hypothetical protein [Candidatus Cloacimonadota bacterium]
MKKYVVLVVLFALMTTPLFAQMKMNLQGKQMMQREGKGKMEHPMKKCDASMGFPFWMADELELSDDQIDQVMDFLAQSKKQIIDLKADIDKLEIDQRIALKDEDFKAAQKLVDQIYAKKADIAKEHINVKEKVHSILTQDQIEKMKDLRSEMPKGHPNLHHNCEE